MRRFANLTNPVHARRCSRILFELRDLSCPVVISFATCWPARGQHSSARQTNLPSRKCQAGSLGDGRGFGRNKSPCYILLVAPTESRIGSSHQLGTGVRRLYVRNPLLTRRAETNLGAFLWVLHPDSAARTLCHPDSSGRIDFCFALHRFASNEFHTTLTNQGTDTFLSIFQRISFVVGLNGTQAPLLDCRDGFTNLNEFKVRVCFQDSVYVGLTPCVIAFCHGLSNNKPNNATTLRCSLRGQFCSLFGRTKTPERMSASQLVRVFPRRCVATTLVHGHTNESSRSSARCPR